MHLCMKFERCSCIRSKDMKGVPEVRNDALDSCPFESKSSRLEQTVAGYYCAVFQVIPITDFRFVVLSYTVTPPPSTHTHTHRDKVIAISASRLRSKHCVLSAECVSNKARDMCKINCYLYTLKIKYSCKVTKITAFGTNQGIRGKCRNPRLP